jgi:Tol biopolymer transport system component
VLATVACLATVLVGVAFSWRGSGDTESFQFRVPVAGLSSGDIAISPDGKLLAFVARPNTGDASSLYVRPTGSTTFTRLVGTDDAAQPFWSPNSQSIGFAAAGRLKTVDAGGGAPKDLGPAPGFTGGAWGTGQVILFGSAKGLTRVSAEGGKSEVATTVDKDEAGHYWPSFLPDGEHYLFLSWSATPANRVVYLGSLGSKDRTKLMTADSNATYASPGYVVFHREATLFAQAFDAATFKLSGNPLHIADQVEFSPGDGRGNFDVSGQGALVYFQGRGGRGGRGGAAGRGNFASAMQFGWRDRTGKSLGLAGENYASVGDLDLSPDGRQIALTLPDPASAGADIYVIDWQRAGVAARLTLDPGDDINPVFSKPLGDKVAFTTYRKGNADIYIRNTNGTGDETPLLATPADESIEAWSNDGRYIAYKLGHDGTEDIWVMPLFGDKKPFPMVQGPFHKDEPQFSYDGKWLAYTSDESNGKFQVFVTSFPGREEKLQISKDGGGAPRWRDDGKELFFRSPDDGVMAADIMTVPKLDARVPHLLFTGIASPSGRDPVRHMWAVTPNGQQFLLKVPARAGARGTTPGIPFATAGRGSTGGTLVQQAPVSSGLTVIRNWPSLFKKGAQ